MNWLQTRNNGIPIATASIPQIPYAQFAEDMVALLAHEANHCVEYFATPDKKGLRMYAAVANDRTGEIAIGSYTYDYYQSERLESLTPRLAALHVFEREITELTGLSFKNSTWDKPLTYPHNRFHKGETIDNYPFFDMPDKQLHLVQVGPVHAGIIEPGAFRFICQGEKIHHLEIALGYQHRGTEQMICQTESKLRQMALAESIAGDSTVAHATAMALILEMGANQERLNMERSIALELERIAVHIGDTSALCMDMGYQLGHVACEALRTIVINTTQLWCGSRFGRSLVRPYGSRFPLTDELIRTITDNISHVCKRYSAVQRDLLSNPGILARTENVCTVSRHAALSLGGVGMAARASGLQRDLRLSHNFVYGGATPPREYSDILLHNSMEDAPYNSGDLLSRLVVRMQDVQHSAKLINMHCATIGKIAAIKPVGEPSYDRPLAPDSLHIALVEGWRGEVCHAAITDNKGRFANYKIVDPSRHNWMLLAMSVRGAQISDFPVSNKSFNLSYCGHDL